MDALTTTLGVALAGALAGALALARRADRLALERDALRERLAQRERDEERLAASFEALAARALRGSNEELVRLASQVLEAKGGRAVAEVERRREAIDALLGPVRDALKRAEEQLGRVERGNAGVRAHLERVASASDELRLEASRLSAALRRPSVRGRYGEVQLERVVELAGMRRWCDFTPQEAIRDEDGRLQRPDLVVRLPGGRVIAVDAKTPYDAYLDALDAETDDERDRCLDRHAQRVLDQVRSLGRKEYWAQLEALELVVMFVPGDQLVDAALSRRPELVELAAERDVVLASPSTLLGILRAVHVGWRERELSEHAEELLRLGRELHERASIVLERTAAVGDALDGARRRYNELVGSLDQRLVPTLRRFEEHGARSARRADEPRTLPAEPRELRSLP